MINIKRAYEKSSKGDGYRILVDQLWPRGITKENAEINLWMKEIAPSKKLRKWFSHDPKKWTEFQKKYRNELKKKKELIEKLIQIEKEKKNITFVYAAKDEKFNNAVALKEYLENHGKQKKPL